MTMPRPLLALLILVGLAPAALPAQADCGMWAGPLSVSKIEVPCNTGPQKYLVKGQGQFSTCCGGPGCWPTVTIINLTTLYETYVEVGGCGGSNSEYRYVFTATPGLYEVGDSVMFLRGNRTLFNGPVLCDESGATIVIEAPPPLADPPADTTPYFNQGVDGNMGTCPPGMTNTIRNWGCLLMGYTMILNYHLSKHGLGAVSDEELDRYLAENGGYQEGEHCAAMSAEAQDLLVRYGRSLGIPGFQRENCPATIDGVSSSICKHGPTLITTRGIRNHSSKHFVVGIASSADGNFGILDPGGRNNTSLSAHGNVIRGCRSFSSAPRATSNALSAPENGGTGDLSILSFYVPAEDAFLTVTDEQGRTTGYDAASMGLTSTIPDSRADLFGSVDHHGDPDQATGDFLTIDLFEPSELFLLDVHPITDRNMQVVVRGSNHSGGEARAAVEVKAKAAGSSTAAVFLSSREHDPDQASLSVTPLEQHGGPFVASLLGQVPRPGTSERDVLFSGILWPVGQQDWTLTRIVLENIGTADAASRLKDVELYADVDGDRVFSDADLLLSTGRFDEEQKAVFMFQQAAQGPLGFFVVADVVEPVSAASLGAGCSKLAVLAATVGLLLLMCRMPRSWILTLLLVAIPAATSSCSGGGGGRPRQQNPQLTLSLVEVDAESSDPLQALEVDGLPTIGWQVDL